jgi:hypothetical protein
MQRRPFFTAALHLDELIRQPDEKKTDLSGWISRRLMRPTARQRETPTKYWPYLIPNQMEA